MENLVKVQDDPRYKFIKGDICDASAVEKAMDGIDVVVHFAAESHVDRAILEPGEFIKTNVFGTFVLLQQALKKKVRFHHVSTDEVFGALPLNGGIFNEQTPYAPRNPYSASKAGSDHLVRSYAATYGLPVTITNCSNNFGPFQFPEKLISLAITNLLEGKKVPVYGDGLYVRDWLYVVDHCRAIESVLERGRIGETYCVGGMTTDVPNIEIIKKILNILGKSEDCIEFVKDRPGHDRRYSVDWIRIRTDLGWQPEHDFDTWLARTVEWYDRNRAWWQRVKSGDYKKYYELQYGKR